jgi:hypothetical protein
MKSGPRSGALHQILHRHNGFFELISGNRSSVCDAPKTLANLLDGYRVRHQSLGENTLVFAAQSRGRTESALRCERSRVQQSQFDAKFGEIVGDDGPFSQLVNMRAKRTGDRRKPELGASATRAALPEGLGVGLRSKRPRSPLLNLDVVQKPGHRHIHQLVPVMAEDWQRLHGYRSRSISRGPRALTCFHPVYVPRNGDCDTNEHDRGYRLCPSCSVLPEAGKASGDHRDNCAENSGAHQYPHHDFVQLGFAGGSTRHHRPHCRDEANPLGEG